MVMLYIAGKVVGRLADADTLVAELTQSKQEIEIRDDAGKLLGRIVPAAPVPVDPHQLELGIDHAEALRILNDTTSRSYSADEVAAKMREIICSH